MSYKPDQMPDGGNRNAKNDQTTHNPDHFNQTPVQDFAARVFDAELERQQSEQQVIGRPVPRPQAGPAGLQDNAIEPEQITILPGAAQVGGQLRIIVAVQAGADFVKDLAQRVDVSALGARPFRRNETFGTDMR